MFLRNRWRGQEWEEKWFLAWLILEVLIVWRVPPVLPLCRMSWFLMKTMGGFPRASQSAGLIWGGFHIALALYASFDGLFSPHPLCQLKIRSDTVQALKQPEKKQTAVKGENFNWEERMAFLEKFRCWCFSPSHWNPSPPPAPLALGSLNLVHPTSAFENDESEWHPLHPESLPWSSPGAGLS